MIEEVKGTTVEAEREIAFVTMAGSMSIAVNEIMIDGTMIERGRERGKGAADIIGKDDDCN